MGTFVDSPCSLLLLAGCIVCTNVAGILGSFVTETGPGSWYAEELVKPWFLPPPLAFPVVWTALYILMGISLYLVLRNGLGDSNVRTAGVIFGGQLLLNVAWSYAFFGLQSPIAGMLVICALWGAVAASIWSFYRVDRVAAYLLVPYIAWVSFAAILNGAILLLN